MQVQNMRNQKAGFRKTRLGQGAFFLSLGLSLGGGEAEAQASSVNINGKVTDSLGAPLAAATVKLETLGLTTTSDANGAFSFGGGTFIVNRGAAEHALATLSLHQGHLVFETPRATHIEIQVLGTQGQVYGQLRRDLAMGSHRLALPAFPRGYAFVRIRMDQATATYSLFASDGKIKVLGLPSSASELTPLGALAKAAAAPIYEVLTAEKAGYQKAYVSVNSPDSSGIQVKMLKEGTTKFSFFVVSLKAVLDLSGHSDGFGGDLTFGETGPGAGLRGADKICATVAERSLAGSSVKGWRAFLSVTADSHGKQVNAIDRVGNGPWYDRIGRVLAPTKADLLDVRPKNGDSEIQLDLPNEDGIPNHRPDPTKPADDNHHMLTGSNTDGKLKSSSATCKDWTIAEANSTYGQPTAGFAWPRGGRVSNQGSHWISGYDAHGCGRGVQIIETGGGSRNVLTVGEGGGYGGFYCFALNP